MVSVVLPIRSVSPVEQALGHDHAARGKDVCKITSRFEHYFAVKRVAGLNDLEFRQQRIVVFPAANHGVKLPDPAAANRVPRLKLPDQTDHRRREIEVGSDDDVGCVQGSGIIEHG